MKNPLLKVAISVLMVLFLSQAVLAEFYKYTDDDGHVFFVDDMSKVPEKYHYQLQIYKEKYDNLPAEEREKRLQDDRIRDAEAEAARRQSTMDYIEEQRSKREMREKDAAARRNRNRETPVEIRGNVILVPVKIRQGGNEVSLRLVLDTGAGMVVLHREAIRKLNIRKLGKTLATVANGSKVSSDVTVLDKVTVGPNIKEKVIAGVLDVNSPDYDGLLGMTFLKGLNYHIDFEKKVVRWNP